jgi:hypothetical protein
MTGRTRALAAGIAAAVAAYSCAARGDRDFNPCDSASTRAPRIVVLFKQSSGFLGIGGGCKVSVHPDSKKVCQGDTVSWSVVNTCDTETFSNLLIPDLNDVTANPCSGQAIAQLGPGRVEQLQCTLKPNIQQKAKYSISSGSTVLVDPELDIRR